MRQFFNVGIKSVLFVFVISTFLYAYTTIPAGSVSGVKTAGTYFIEGNISVADGNTLTLEAGVVFKFATATGLTVVGTLDVNGSSENKVIFTSLNDNSTGETISGSTGSPQPGDWNGLYVWPGPATFDYCVFRYGGSSAYHSNLKFHAGSSGHFINSISEYSLTYGLYADGATSLEISGSTFSNNGGSTYEGVIILNASVADVVNNIFNDNGGFGAYIGNGTAGTFTGNTGSGNAIDAIAVAALQVNSNLSWSASESFPIRLYKPDGGYAHSVTVAEGITLTFAAGTFPIDHTVSINGAGNFALSAGASLELKGYIENEFTNGINDQITVSGTKTLDPGANFIFSGAGAQVSGTQFPSAVNNLSINNSTGLTLSSGLTVGGTLNLVSGNLSTGSNTLTIGTSASSTGSVSRTSGTVIGNLQRWIAASEISDILFPMGTADHYRPMNLSYTSAPSSGGTLTAGFTASNPGSSGLPLSDSGYTVNTVSPDGYWSLSSADGLSGGTYDLDINAEGFGGVSDYSTLRVLKRADSGSAWTLDGSHVTGTGSNEVPVLHRSGLSGFSEFGVGSNVNDNSLPVTLTNFTADMIKGNVVLEWSTSAEVENQGFILSRQSKAKGQSPEIIASFSTNDALKGQGSTTETTRYQYVDISVEPGMTYVYILADVDYAGHQTTLAEVELQVKTEGAIVADGYTLNPVYPNPFNATLTVPFTLTESMKVRIDLYNLAGKHVFEGINNEYSMGSYQIKITADHLVSGIYLVRTSFNEHHHIQKVILLK